jgi:hypothetical protein
VDTEQRGLRLTPAAVGVRRSSHKTWPGSRRAGFFLAESSRSFRGAVAFKPTITHACRTGGRGMARSRKKISATLKTAKVDYRGVLPTVVPKGKVLVHSNVRPKTKDQVPGARGFRAWAEKPSRLLVPCNCGWSGLPHYRSRTPSA